MTPRQNISAIVEFYAFVALYFWSLACGSKALALCTLAGMVIWIHWRIE